jgi:hypothetical protein
VFLSTGKASLSVGKESATTSDDFHFFLDMMNTDFFSFLFFFFFFLSVGFCFLCLTSRTNVLTLESSAQGLLRVLFALRKAVLTGFMFLYVDLQFAI